MSSKDPIPEYWLEGIDDDLDFLSVLTEAERKSIKVAFKLWVKVAAHHRYTPICHWENFPAEVDHSALLDRILSGKKPLLGRPELDRSYPVYPD